MADTSFGEKGAMASAMDPSSPGRSSPESFEVDDDPNNHASSGLQEQTSPSSNSTSQLPRPTPLQKRRRVTRACDECRRKKIKCDGRQPCTHCTVYSYDCTYDQPSNRRRNPAPQYIEALENRLQRAETLLRTFLPNIDLNDPQVDILVQQHQDKRNGNDFQHNHAQTTSAAGAEEQDSQLRSMIESTGALDLDESGRWDFHGASSGTAFMKKMKEQFGAVMGSQNTPLFPKVPRQVEFSNSPRSATESPFDSALPNTLDLPPREVARLYCADALDRATILLRVVHQPSFYEMFDRIYDIPPENYGDSENRFLPLLYVACALGCLFHNAPGEDSGVQKTFQSGLDQAIKYYRAARNMMDITDCRDITSLQAIVFMINFLQSSANLSTCYSYIGIALRSALRMGLHRNLKGNFNPIDHEIRRRVFWAIRRMDIYVSALLGFPVMLSLDDIDQDFPTEVDDEYITKDGVLSTPQNSFSLLAAGSNAHTRLMFILATVIQDIYPIKGVESSMNGSGTASYAISHAKITAIEQDLAQWLDKLPMALKPGGEGSLEVARVQQLLRLSYAHVQMMLYRPFLHYVSGKVNAGKMVDGRAYACAAASISVSRNIVHITAEMKRRGLLFGAYWFTMYTTFFAIISLAFFILENPDKPESQEYLSDANDGREALQGLAKRSQAADRCTIALKSLFEQLPQRLKDGTPLSAAPQKKRSAQPSNLTGTRSEQIIPAKSPLGSTPKMGLPSRATTFPLHAPAPAKQRASMNGNHFQNNRSNSNLRQSFHEHTSPIDMSATATPDSSSTGNSMHPLRYAPQQPFGMDNGVSDLNAMMFPSADPFAYPNQPMLEFSNVKQENFRTMDGSQAVPVYVPTTSEGQAYDDLEGQLFGPLPTYLTQGQSNFDLNQGMGPGGMMNSMNQEFNYPPGLAPNDEMAGFSDGLYPGNTGEWGSMLGNQRYRQ